MVADARQRVEAKRETSTTVSIAFDAFGSDVEAGGSVLAAALGFRVFLFFVPYVAFVLLIAGYVVDIFDKSPDELFRGSGIAALTATGVATVHDWSSGARIAALLFVAYALFLSAGSFVKVLRIVHTLVWRTPPTRLRGYTRATLVFIGLVTLAIALAGLLDAVRQHYLIPGLVALALYSVVPFAAWWIVSWWLPHGDCDLLGLAPGAVLFAIGVEALHVVTVVWLPHAIQSKSDIYGTIGSALALLFWAYLLGRLMAVTAALNFSLWRRVGPNRPPPPHSVVRLPIVGVWIERVWSRLSQRPAPAVENPPPEASPEVSP
jgi:uncharacterized BrkB/YihY/UPF0761 family membrane protein